MSNFDFVAARGIRFSRMHLARIFIKVAFFYFSTQKEDEIEEYYKKKYGESSVAARFGEGEDMSDEITQQGLLPGVK